MTRLFLIDHSLATNGGHHFKYASLLAAAAVRRGWQPIVASHWALRFRRRLWPVACPVEPLYPSAGSPAWVATSGAATKLPMNPFRAMVRDDRPWDPEGGTSTNLPDEQRAKPEVSLWGRLAQWSSHKRQVWHVRGFVAATRRLFRKYPLASGDLVFLSTVNDFDMVGLVEFLALHPEAACAGWHLQFHFPLVMDFWTGEASQRARMKILRQHFQPLVARIPNVRLHLFTPTSSLAEQYQQLEIGPVRVLPDTVSVPFHTPRAGAIDAHAPLRVLCAGGLRKGKSSWVLKSLIDELARHDFAQGRLQLWVQASRQSDLRRESGGRNWFTAHPQGPAPPAGTPLVHVPHPVSTPAYERLMELADIGLLAYRSKTYTARGSGVLVEFLASGVPVIVPGGTWMAMEVSLVGGAAADAPGLIAAEDGDYARHLLTMADEYFEYQRRAARIAPAYANQHSPDAVLEHLQRIDRASVSNEGPVARP